MYFLFITKHRPYSDRVFKNFTELSTVFLKGENILMQGLHEFFIRKVAVLGSGVMGSQIAAHFANANVPVVLFDLASQEKDPSSIAQNAIKNLLKLEPSPVVLKSKTSLIQAANYNTDLALLSNCTLIVEAISERLDFKQDLYAKVAPHLSKQNIFVSNTSGLSIETLAQALPEELRANFCGVHFFNPPRYMMLVELIAHAKTNEAVLNNLETFLTSKLGKGVVRAKDTPNFIANRVGIFSMLSTVYYSEKFKLGFDTVDALTGTHIGRAKSATYRTLDVVGLDTFAHVTKTMEETLTNDPWKSLFTLPKWLNAFIKQGVLGQKTRQGVYKKVGKVISVFDLDKKDYRPSDSALPEEIIAILKTKDPKEKFKKLRESNHPHAQFLWALFRDLFHYCSTWLSDIADNARDLDFAVRWGFGWKRGPFEIWQEFGWQEVAKAIQEDIANGKTLCNQPLPKWVLEANRTAVHTPEGSYSAKTNQYEPRRKLPVYERQLFPETVLGEAKPNFGKTVYENEGVRLWTLDSEIGILSFKSKMHAVGSDVLDGVLESVKLAEGQFKGLVLWQPEPPFSAGANLLQVTTAISENDFEQLEVMIKKFQDASMALKYSLIPTIAAVQGLALGGGCEFVMHCAKAVAHTESYMGLVEIGVGLLPAGGGCKEFALRAAQEAKGTHIFPFLQKRFETIGMAKVSKSAHEAKELGYLKADDIVVFHPNEVLHVAMSTAKSMYEASYRPAPLGKTIQVTGTGGTATIKAALLNMKEGQFISEYDFKIGSMVADILGGGAVEQGTLVDEQYLLDLEFKYFMELLKNPKTKERINFMLKNGKPLRN